MTSGEGLRFLVLTLTVVGSFLLVLAAGETGTTGERTLPLFVTWQLLLAHLLFALPLGLYLRRWLPGSLVPRLELLPAMMALVGMTIVALGLLPVLAGLARDGAPGFYALLMARCLLAVVLVLPGCAFVGAFEKKPTSAVAFLSGLALPLCLAVVPCGLHANGLLISLHEQAQDFLKRERLARALPPLTAFLDLGGESLVVGQPPMTLRKNLAKQVQRLEQRLAPPLAPSAGPEARLARALELIQLSRLDEAARLLEPLANGRNSESLLLATVYQEQQRWADSDRHFQSVLDALAPHLAAGAQPACWTALEGLLYNARQTRHIPAVEALLARGMELFPERRADWHFQMGQHLAHAGRPIQAIDQFLLAQKLAPQALGSQARQEIERLRTATPACLLAIPQPSKGPR